MATFGNFNPKMVAIIYAGIPITGFSDGEFLTIENNEDDYKLKVGADGEQTRVRINDLSARVTIKLAMTSPSNAFLSTRRQRDLVLDIGLSVGFLSITDLSTGAQYFAEKAWIAKPPTSSFGDEATEREWVLECGALSLRIEGTGTPEGIIAAGIGLVSV